MLLDQYRQLARAEPIDHHEQLAAFADAPQPAPWGIRTHHHAAAQSVMVGTLAAAVVPAVIAFQVCQVTDARLHQFQAPHIVAATNQSIVAITGKTAVERMAGEFFHRSPHDLLAQTHAGEVTQAARPRQHSRGLVDAEHGMAGFHIKKKKPSRLNRLKSNFFWVSRDFTHVKMMLKIIANRNEVSQSMVIAP